MGFNIGSYTPQRYCKNVEDFKNDLRAISPISRLVKSYSLDDCTFPILLDAAQEINFKVILGVWVTPTHTNMSAEIKKLKSLSNYSVKTIHSFVVGSEVLYRQDLNADKLADLIYEFRESLKYIKDKDGISYSNIPVGFADTWNAIVEQDTRKVIQVSDTVYINIFPYWQGKMVDESSSSLLNNLSDAYKKIMDIKGDQKMPIWIGETGWPTKGKKHLSSVPSIRNSKIFWDNVVCGLLSWNVNVLLFEAFDEPLKHENISNVENYWGFWDVNRVRKFDLACDFSTIR